MQDQFSGIKIYFENFDLTKYILIILIGRQNYSSAKKLVSEKGVLNYIICSSKFFLNLGSYVGRSQLWVFCIFGAPANASPIYQESMKQF